MTLEPVEYSLSKHCPLRVHSAAQADRNPRSPVRVPDREAGERQGGDLLQGFQLQAGRRGGLVPQQCPLQPGQRYAETCSRLSLSVLWIRIQIGSTTGKNSLN